MSPPLGFKSTPRNQPQYPNYPTHYFQDCDPSGRSVLVFPLDCHLDQSKYNSDGAKDEESHLERDRAPKVYPYGNMISVFIRFRNAVGAPRHVSQFSLVERKITGTDRAFSMNKVGTVPEIYIPTVVELEQARQLYLAYVPKTYSTELLPN